MNIDPARTHDSSEPAVVPDPQVGSAPGQPAYEPPRLVLVGNLRNLLGKSGGRPDLGPGTKKP